MVGTTIALSVIGGILWLIQAHLADIAQELKKGLANDQL